VLSGAGISTESGIPDYRSPERSGKARRPMLYQEFVSSDAARRRYWARSVLGWGAVAGARPNPGHRALARLEESGVLAGVLTQNVDGLHQKAGSRDVLELHGRLASVLCLGCRSETKRELIQSRLLELNPHLRTARFETAPDGDSDLPDELVELVTVPACGQCGGVLKPDVVFFGENVPKVRSARAAEMLERAEVLLVAGSSLTVMSGFRWVLAAYRAGKPVAIVNDGPTRGDECAALKVEGRLGELLPALEAVLA
jgi:NAD-dependent deacetylase sirtuin 4